MDLSGCKFTRIEHVDKPPTSSGQARAQPKRVARRFDAPGTFDGRTVIDEADAATWRIPAESRIVTFVNRKKLPVDEARVADALRSEPGASTVRGLAIGFFSHMRSLIVAPCFPEVTSVAIQNPGMLDISALARLSKLIKLDVTRIAAPMEVLPQLRLTKLILDVKSPDQVATVGRCDTLHALLLRDLKEPDLKQLSPLNLVAFRLRGGHVQWLDGIRYERLTSVSLQACKRLQTVAPLSAESLNVEECHHLNLESVASVRGLRRLALRSLKQLKSLEFIERCESLHSLTIAAPRSGHPDYSVLHRSKSLQAAFLPVPARKLREISKLLPKLLLSCGTSSFQNGQQIDKHRFHEIFEMVKFGI
jgi:hypothetical protein